MSKQLFFNLFLKLRSASWHVSKHIACSRRGALKPALGCGRPPATVRAIRRATARSAASGLPNCGRPVGAPATGLRSSPRDGRFGIKTSLVPIETTKLDQPSRPGAAVGDQRFVIDIEPAVGRQHRPLVLDQPLILPVFEDEIAVVAREIHAADKVRKINRQTGVDRVPAAMDDAGLRENEVNEPDHRKLCVSLSVTRTAPRPTRANSPR